MITAQRLLTELGNRAWSGFNADDMQFGNEEARQALAELNFALRYLINLSDFPFRTKTRKFTTRIGNSNYIAPDGQITNIYKTNTLNNLIFLGEGSKYDKTAKGEPTGYWIDYNNPDEKLRLYPIPDTTGDYTITYSQYKPVMDANFETKSEFTAPDDFINMPENLEYLFMDCLVLRTMVTNNKDIEDENYQPMINEFNEAWKVFLRASKPAKINTRIVGL